MSCPCQHNVFHSMDDAERGPDGAAGEPTGRAAVQWAGGPVCRWAGDMNFL